MSKVLGEKETVIVEFTSEAERSRFIRIAAGIIADRFDGYIGMVNTGSQFIRFGYSNGFPTQVDHLGNGKTAHEYMKKSCPSQVSVKSEDIQHWSDLVKLGIGKVPEQYKDCRVEVTNLQEVEKIKQLFGGEASPIFLQAKVITIYVNNSCVVGWDHGRAASYDNPWVQFDELFGQSMPKKDQQAMPACSDCGCTELFEYSTRADICASCGQLRDKPSTPLWPGMDQILIHKGNTDHITDPLTYAVGVLAGLSKPSKEDTMNTDTSFKTIHTINGNNVKNLTVGQFLQIIQDKKNQINQLSGLDIKSDVLNGQIAAQEADLALIIAKMEEIHGEEK